MATTIGLDGMPSSHSATARYPLRRPTRPPNRPPSRHPAASEYRFCDISAADCPERIEAAYELEAATNDDFRWTASTTARNGSVVRAIIMQHLIRHDFLPIVVTRYDQSDYIDASRPPPTAA